MRPWAALALAFTTLSACASSLRAPRPLVKREAFSGRPASELAGDAAVAWAQRPDLAAVEAADAAWSEAAMVDGEAVDALVGALRAKAWIVQHDARAERRERAAVSAVDAALWCKRRRPEAAMCDYWLGIALGMQAREKTSTGADGMREMDKALKRAIAKEPGLEEGGPHRVRALLLLKAPAWPLGIGDVDAALEEAQRALALGPEHPYNQLVLAQALDASGEDDAAKAAYEKTLELAKARLAADPECADWIEEAEAGLAAL